MNKESQQSGFQPIRHDRLLQEARHDAYKTMGKLPEPAVCSDCGAVFHDGRWQWLPAPANAHQTSCPACHRIRDHFPAGYVTLSGNFFPEHEHEILQLIQHREAQEKISHPLQRIMAIEKTAQGTQITTTDIHLARGIGEALHHAYQGELEYHYNPDQNLLRVNWAR
jgi:NMD protein affecting ribosome stability and mRNA decay